MGGRQERADASLSLQPGRRQLRLDRSHDLVRPWVRLCQKRRKIATERLLTLGKPREVAARVGEIVAQRVVSLTKGRQSLLRYKFGTGEGVVIAVDIHKYRQLAFLGLAVKALPDAEFRVFGLERVGAGTLFGIPNIGDGLRFISPILAQKHERRTGLSGLKVRHLRQLTEIRCRGLDSLFVYDRCQNLIVMTLHLCEVGK